MKILQILLVMLFVVGIASADVGEKVWGKSTGVISFVAGEGGTADIPDPRDLDNDGIYNESSDTVVCGSRCSFESNTGNKWVHDSTTSTWRCVTCRTFFAPMMNARVAGAAAAAELCIRLWGVHDLAIASRLSCLDTNVQAFLIGSLDSVLSASDPTFVLERLCVKVRGSPINGNEGATFWISDDGNTTKLAKLNVPEVQNGSLLDGDVACSNETPVRVDKTEGNLIVLVVQDGPFCTVGSSCVANSVNLFLTTLILEL